MALNLLRKQTECIIRMLNLNQAVSTANEEVYKILIYDRFCQGILSPLIRVKDLRKHGVTLYFLLDKDRNPVHDVPAVYFLQPTTHNIQRVVVDASKGLYDAFHLNFSSSIPRPLLEDLATGTTQSDSIQRISKVLDQYLEFVTLEDNLFSLANKSCYVHLNDPSAGDKEIEEIIEKIVAGLFCVLATLAVVPVITCPRGGPQLRWSHPYWIRDCGTICWRRTICSPRVEASLARFRGQFFVYLIGIWSYQRLYNMILGVSHSFMMCLI